MNTMDSVERWGRNLRVYAESMKTAEQESETSKRGIYEASVKRLEKVAADCKVFTDFVESQRRRIDGKTNPAVEMSKKQIYWHAKTDWNIELLNLCEAARRSESATQEDCIYIEQYLYEWFKIRIIENCNNGISNFILHPNDIWKMIFALCVAYAFLAYKDKIEQNETGISFYAEFKKWEEAVKSDSTARDTFALPETANAVYHQGHWKFEYSEMIPGISLFKRCVYDRVKQVKNNDVYGIPRNAIKMLLEEKP